MSYLDRNDITRADPIVPILSRLGISPDLSGDLQPPEDPHGCPNCATGEPCPHATELQQDIRRLYHAEALHKERVGAFKAWVGAQRKAHKMPLSDAQSLRAARRGALEEHRALLRGTQSSRAIAKSKLLTALSLAKQHGVPKALVVAFVSPEWRMVELNCWAYQHPKGYGNLTYGDFLS